MWRTALILFLFGALIGNAYNSFHAFSGTIPVTAIHINPLSDWTSYFLFGFAGLSIGCLTLFFDKVFKRHIPVVSSTNVAGALIFLGVFYFLSACIFFSNTLILIILTVGFVWSVIRYDPSGIALQAAILVAVVGTFAEVYFVHSGMYYYSRPQILGVAYWLPFLYGIASVTTGQLARALYARFSSPANQIV